MSRIWKRRRGTAIVETKNGILVASGRRKIYLLPGGKAEKGESREKAAIRELEEETGLETIESTYLFRHLGKVNKAHGGGFFQDHHKVFLIKAKGVARPRHEIKYIELYTPESKIHISGVTKEIIEKYYLYKEQDKKDYSHKETGSKSIFTEDGCFKVLGLKSTASNAELSKRFKQLATIYHPDRALNDEIREIHHQKMSELNQAYQKIKKIRGIQ